jgi:anti-anti-sigma factor
MNFKIDTKEKFHVISLNEPQFTANMTDKLRELFNEVTQNDVKHIILNLKTVQSLEQPVVQFLADQHHKAYASNRSFVLCEIQPPVKDILKKLDLLDLLNVTPTESEAWDIVQMEEVERELLGGEENQGPWP